MNLSLVKEIVLDLVQRHHNTNGVGPDPYQPAPMRHAMAEGKLLTAVAVLAESRVLGTQQVETIAASSLERLDTLQTENDHGISFGLGFGWKGMSPATPFTITTAVVVEGLERISAVVRDPTPFESMAAETTRWLTSEEALDPGSGLPNFSPAYPTVVTNVVGFWAHVLRERHPDLAAAGRRHVDAAYVDDIGWTYVPDENRLDLLHTCYTARAVLGDADQARNIATAISRFITPSGLLDKVDVLSLEEADAAASRATSTCITIDGSRAYLLHAAPARLWSIGELLTVCAARPGDGSLDGFWRSVAIRAIEQLDSMNLEADGPRHTMHVAHGLASHLAAERSRNE